jgi:SSS family solute:Na+ symporter
MTGESTSFWLPLYGLFYCAVVLYWARVAAVENRNVETYFSAGHDLAPWISALTLAGAALSCYFVLGGADDIARRGLTSPALLQAGIALALPGTIFFKRMWFVCQRLRLSSQAELFRAYYGSDFLVVVSTAIAVLFAVGFAGLQARAISHLLFVLSDGAVSPLVVGAILGTVMFGYVAIGGMRAVGYLGAIQSILVAAAATGLAAYALYVVGGFAALNGKLQVLASDPAGAGLFTVSGVVHFTAGLGRQAEDAIGPTALTSLGLAFAFMGLQASPLAAKIVLSTRNARGFGASQTWVLAAAFGGLILFGTAIIGAAALVDRAFTVAGLLGSLRDASPWFAAWIAIGLVAGMQVLAGLGLLVAGESLVRNVYKPYFHAALSRRATVNITRIVVGLLALASLLLQALAPVTLSALGGIALPLSFQLWTPLLGVTWLRWITRPAAVTGVGFGIAGVLLTEPLGYSILSFLGLELPWGRWPWTIPSAAWGGAANVAATLIISAITNRQAFGEEARDVRDFLATTLRPVRRIRGITSFAWSVVLVWLFFALGPGLVFGNFALGLPSAGRPWVAGMPSLWAWSAVAWALGVGLIWFLAYRMEMANPVHAEIPAYEPRRRLWPDTRRQERARLVALGIAAAATFAVIVLLALGFGGR